MLGVDVAHHRFCQEELVTVGTVLPGEGGLRRARPPCVRQGHVGGLARGPQGPGGGGGRGGGGEDGVWTLGHPGAHRSNSRRRCRLIRPGKQNKKTRSRL